MPDLPLTYLFVSGDRPDRFDKALASGAAAIIVDLEDAVQHVAVNAAACDDTGPVDGAGAIRQSQHTPATPDDRVALSSDPLTKHWTLAP